jgi:hypothetical protein
MYTFGLFLFLDPFQWLVLITAILGAGICGYLYFTNQLHRLKMGLLFGFNIYVILRYILIIWFRQDSLTLSTDETTILNQLAQIAQVYIESVIIYLAWDARRQSKILARIRGMK